MSGEKILVVEDNPKVSGLLTRDILPNLGYKAILAEYGKEALAFIERDDPVLVLLDLQLPDMDGMEVLRQLHQRGIYIPTILMTAHGSEQVAVEAFRLGVHDYLTKPLDLSQLAEAIERILRSNRLQQERDSLVIKLEQQVRQTAVLTRIGQMITSSLDTDEVLRRIVEAAVYLTHAEEGFLLLHDDETDELLLRAEKNLGDRDVAIRRVPVNDNILGLVYRTGKALHTPQTIGRDDLKLKTGYLVKASLHVPLKARNKVLGVLSVDNTLQSKAFTEAHESLLSSLGSYAAIALDNARLYHESRQHAQRTLNYAHELDAAYKAEQQQRKALDRLRSSFLNSIGHELKTPLNVMLQSLELLNDSRRGTLNEGQKDVIRTLNEQTHYLKRMIEGLVAFATFSAKQGQLKLAECPLEAILDEARDVTVFKAKAKDITLSETRPPHLPHLPVDRERLTEAIMHLLDNAIKFSSTGSTVDLRAELTTETVRISITDRGPGIPESEIETIWDSFMQMSTSLQRGLEGLGLGLAMARVIVEAHGGHIEVQSKEGEGSTFSIVLPLNATA